MALISKHKIKLLKLFLVSPLLEKFFLVVYVITVPLLILSTKIGATFTPYFYGVQLMNTLNQNAVNSLQDINDVADWITGTLTPAYFTDKTTISKPLFPIFLFKSELDDASCDTYSRMLPECSFVNYNLKASPSKILQIKFSNGQYGSYPISDSIKIPRDVDSLKISTANTFLKSQWLNSSIVYLSAQSIIYNDWDKTFLQFDVSFEFSEEGQVSTKLISFDVVYPELTKGPLYVTLYSFFLIQLIMFTFRVLFEFSMAPNIYTFIGHILHFGIQYAFLLMGAITLQGNKLTTDYSESLPLFVDGSTLLNNIIYSDMILSLILIFYPFRLFTLLSWSKHLKPPLKLLIVLYRTFPGLFLLLFGFVIIWICFSLVPFIGLGAEVIQVRNYGYSLMNYFSLDLGQIYTSNKVMTNSNLSTLQVIWTFQNLFLGLLLLFMLVVIVDLTKRSFSHELPDLLPNQQELKDKQTELYIKFDKFLKELSSIFGLKNKDQRPKSFSTEDKMVIWLEHGMGTESEVDDITERLSGESIKIMVFYKPEEVEEF